MKALVAAGDGHFAEVLQRHLSTKGFSVDVARSGGQVLELAKVRPYDVFLLDVLLPEQDGYNVVRKLRAAGNRAAILMVTCMGRERDKLEGFESGADDYLVKPISIPELLARIRAIFKRMDESRFNKADPFLLRANALELHQLTHEVRKNGRRLRLTRTEFILLESLMRRPGQVVRRPTLCQHLSTVDSSAATNAINVHMKNLRAKIDGRTTASIIRTVRGVGYALAS